MFSITAKCDKCGKEETQVNRGATEYFNLFVSSWRKVELRFDQYKTKDFLLCLDCQKSLGFFADSKAKQESQEKSLADRLLDVISEIVADQMPSE